MFFNGLELHFHYPRRKNGAFGDVFFHEDISSKSKNLKIHYMEEGNFVATFGVNNTQISMS